MLRYQPPKSNIWGHSLRRMRPSRERALAGEFDKLAVARSTFGSSSLWITRSASAEGFPAELTQQFEALLKKQSHAGFFHLTEPEFEAALDFLISREAELPEWGANVMLSKGVQIEAWRIGGVAIPTESSLSWDFGSNPVVSTTLRFNDRAEFDHVRTVFESLKICRLNEKHLKEMKPRVASR